MTRKTFVLVLGLFSPVIAHCQDGGLGGWIGRKMHKPPTPNTTIQISAEESEVVGAASNIGVSMQYYLVLQDGSHATAICFVVPGGKPCGIQAFAAEKRKATPCFRSPDRQASCFEDEFYKANRTGNDLVVYSGNGASYMEIVGTWDKLQPGTAQSKVN